MIPDPADAAAAALFAPIVTRMDELLADDPECLTLIESGELRSLRRLIVVRQDMLLQGLHRVDTGIDGVRAKYSDDTRADLGALPQEEIR